MSTASALLLRPVGTSSSHPVPTVSVTRSATPVASAASKPHHAAHHQVLTHHEAFLVIVLLVIVAAVIATAQVLLAGTFRPHERADPDHPGQKIQVSNFFEIPFITWYLLHFTVAALGIVAVLILGVDQIISSTAIAALLSGLFGYVLGAVAAKSSSSMSNPGAHTTSTTSSGPPFSLSVKTGPAAGGTHVTLTGDGVGAADIVKFGSAVATEVTKIGANTVGATTPPGTGTVDVTATVSGHNVVLVRGFTYTA